MVSSTQALAHIKSQKFIGHFITTSRVSLVTNVIKFYLKCCIKVGAPRPSTRQHAIWWTTTYKCQCAISP